MTEAHGWLTKQGHLIGTWKRRYFVLVPEPEPRLLYFDQSPLDVMRVIESRGADKSGKSPLGVVPLLACTVDSKDDGRYGFTVLCSGGARYPLRANSAEEKSAWLEIIRGASSGAASSETETAATLETSEDVPAPPPAAAVRVPPEAEAQSDFIRPENVPPPPTGASHCHTGDTTSHPYSFNLIRYPAT